MRCRVTALVCILSAISLPPLAAQSPTASLTGLVMDTTGALLPDTEIVARHLATGYEYASRSDATGRYWLSRLPPGRYELTARRVDVGSAVQRAVRFAIGQELIVNFTIEPRPVELAPLWVVDRRPPIEAAQAKIAFELDRRRIAQLPEESRNFLDLAQLAPGATRSIETGDPVGPTSIGALNQYHLGIVVDGVSLVSSLIGEPLGILPLSAIEEFEVLTTVYSAEYGQAASGVVNAITRRGTNELRSEGFLRYRHHAINALGTFEVEKPDFERTHWGLAAGGPIAQDRTHFFAAFERRAESNFGTVETGGTFPELEGTFEVPFANNLLFGRLDHRLSDAHEITLRYAAQFEDRRADIGVAGSCASLSGATLGSAAYGADETDSMHSLVGLHRWSFGDGQAVNETRVAFQVRDAARNPVTPGPTFAYPSICDGGNWVMGEERSTRFDIRNDFSRALGGPAGSHRLKAGLLAALVDVDARGGNFTNGQFEFDVDSATEPKSFQIALEGLTTDERSVQLAAYVQDQWNPHPSLTLDLGLRYDIETNGTNQGHVTPEAGALPFVPISERPVDTNNLAPRLGVVWDAGGDGRTIIRGGYGVFFNQGALFYSGLETTRNWFVVVGDPGTTNVDSIDVDPAAGVVFPTFLGKRVESPSTRQVSFGVERVVPGDVMLSLDGTVVDGRNLPVFRNLNVVGFTDDSMPILRYPDSGSITAQLVNAGEANARMLIFRARRNSDAAWFDVSYTLGEREITNDSWLDFSPQVDPDSEDFSDEMGPAAWDERHRIVAVGGMRAPWGTGMSIKAIYASGRPFNVTSGIDDNGDLFFNDRPSGVGRNSERGPDFFTLDLALSQRFELGPGQFDIGLNLYNLTNRDNLLPESVSGNLMSPVYGQALAASHKRQAELTIAIRY